MTMFSQFHLGFTASLKVLSIFFQLLIELTRQMLLLLVGSSESTPGNKATENATQGGSLNYRTGKLDDGTDPYGWYDND